MLQTILRRHDVERLTGLPRSTIYDKIARGEFPQPIKLSAKSVGWLESEIADWQNARIAARDDAEVRARPHIGKPRVPTFGHAAGGVR